MRSSAAREELGLEQLLLCLERSQLSCSRHDQWGGDPGEDPGLGGEIMGPILHPAQLTFYTDACIVANLQLAQSVLFPPPPRVAKLVQVLHV